VYFFCAATNVAVHTCANNRVERLVSKMTNCVERDVKFCLLPQLLSHCCFFNTAVSYQ